jgi:hypothetical protein
VDNLERDHPRGGWPTVRVAARAAEFKSQPAAAEAVRSGDGLLSERANRREVPLSANAERPAQRESLPTPRHLVKRLTPQRAPRPGIRPGFCESAKKAKIPVDSSAESGIKTAMVKTLAPQSLEQGMKGPWDYFLAVRHVENRPLD